MTNIKQSTNKDEANEHRKTKIKQPEITNFYLLKNNILIFKLFNSFDKKYN